MLICNSFLLCCVYKSEMAKMKVNQDDHERKHLLLNPPFTREFKNRFRLSINPFPLVGCPILLQGDRAAYSQAARRGRILS
jgi:hypothetical protein